jgi:hypothetical protein
VKVAQFRQSRYAVLGLMRSAGAAALRSWKYPSTQGTSAGSPYLAKMHSV